jgi:hypothetical protein
MKRSIDDYLSMPYRIKWSADFSEWTRDVKTVHLTCWLEEIPEVIGEATTADGALSNLQDNFGVYLKDAALAGSDVPEP